MADYPPVEKKSSKSDKTEPDPLRVKAMEMAMEFHKGMHNDAAAVVGTARAILAFIKEDG